LWVPLVIPPRQEVNSRSNHWLITLARLKPGAGFEQAREQMVAIAKRLEQQYPDSQAGRSVFLIPLQEETVRDIRPALLALMFAVGFVLLIAWANLPRASSRLATLAPAGTKTKPRPKIRARAAGRRVRTVCTCNTMTRTCGA